MLEGVSMVVDEPGKLGRVCRSVEGEPNHEIA